MKTSMGDAIAMAWMMGIEIKILHNKTGVEVELYQEETRRRHSWAVHILSEQEMECGQVAVDKITEIINREWNEIDREFAVQDFRAWLTGQVKRDDPVGDLAIDFLKTKCCADHATELGALGLHLKITHRADDIVLSALTRAWGEFSGTIECPF